MSDAPNELPVDTSQGIPKIPHLEVATYGNQETFLLMLETILNAVIDVTNMLVEREAAREQKESRIITLDQLS